LKADRAKFAKTPRAPRRKEEMNSFFFLGGLGVLALFAHI
jgi:hypothetical protein